MNSPEISPFGSNAINISWEEKIDPELHDQILDFDHFIRTKFTEFDFETVISYHSLVIYLNKDAVQTQLIDALKNLDLSEISTVNRKSVIWQIPTCYESEFGIDLEFVAETSQISVEEVIAIHSHIKYRIYFMGFLPGFLYLGGLDGKIACPRKPNPRISVEAGSVGIAGKQTGIYPQNSPGGWQIIGRTPITLFNLKNDPPILFQAGDLIQFVRISVNEYNVLKEKNNSGEEINLKSTPND